jgi:type II secretory ATPase GspE/PulE/Tfp pilus assembly ATPase PilB-like protein
VKSYGDMQISVVDYVNHLITSALEGHASDIHIEPAEQEVVIRFRIDGLLYVQSTMVHAVARQMISRLKVLAHMDIAESRLPQDGNFTYAYDSHTVDLRVSTFPTVYGQKMVIRILDRDYGFLTFDQLGFDQDVYKIVKSLIDKPHGLLLVTGPTGSGKTTTLYALLDYLNTLERNIVTLEDPVEYHIKGITQGPVNTKIGFDFARGMRSILRQDPDVIMVGEIRDAETAHTAIQAALTGHLVLSTLHTNDAPSAVMRLIDMSIEPYLIKAALSGVIAQRLTRILCACKKKVSRVQCDQERMRELGITQKFFYEPEGCSACANRGHIKRRALLEVMVFSEALGNVLCDGADIVALRRQARREGMSTLAKAAIKCLESGEISLEELFRIL